MLFRSEVPQAFIRKDMAEAKRLAETYLKIFGPDRFFIELQNHGIADQIAVNPELNALAKRLGVATIATNDVHYLEHDDVEAHDVLCCISTGKLVADEDRFKFPNGEFYLKTPEQMADLFPDCPEALDNTLRVAEMCDLDLDFSERHAPVYKVAKEAVDTALRNVDQIEVEPGEYDVVFQEYAVADILDFFAYLSFGAQAYQAKRSFMVGRIGERVMGENISIWDDGLATDSSPNPFDFEGVPRERVDFVEKGVARDVVWDTYTAGKEGDRESTGHALPASSTFGPVPSNMFLATGDATLDEMVASTKRGVWVSRFWYTRPVHPMNVVVTGMTRDGTFLIEDGKFRFVNSRFLEETGFTEDELLGMDSMALVLPEDRPGVHRNAENVAKGGYSKPYEYRGLDKHGNVFWLMGAVILLLLKSKV